MIEQPRVVTLTLHPAIDRIVSVGTLQPGATFDGRAKLVLPAGKGVNTARVLRLLSGKKAKIVAAVWVGQNEAHYFKTRLRKLADIDCAICARPVPTRFAHTFLESSGRETHIKEAMPPPSAAEQNEFIAFWKRTVRKGDIVAVCGSAPAGIKAQVLEEIFRIAREQGARRIIADTNGTALLAAAKSKIDLLKGNASEIGAWLNCGGSFNPESSAHRELLSKSLLLKSAPKIILMTLGGNGALLAFDQTLLHTRPPGLDANFKIVSATGCGDAATAGALWSLLLDESSLEKLLARAVSCGTAKLEFSDPAKLSLKRARSFVRYCYIERF